AATRTAVSLYDEHYISTDESLVWVNGGQLSHLFSPQFSNDQKTLLLTTWMGASPGAAVGDIALDNAHAIARQEEGADVILVRKETNPDDLPGMLASKGILTARGGRTSHAAVVARGLGTCAVVGAEDR